MRITLILLAFFISKGVLADIYRYTDGNGQTHYTNVKPLQSGYKRVLESALPHYYSSRYYRTGTFSGKPSIMSRLRNKSKFADLINQAAYKHRVDPRLVHAVIQTESAYNAHAVSSAGAVGLMQLMPDTAKRYGVTNLTDPDQNIEGGTRYLKDLIEMFTPNLELAVAAYNAGENAVIKYNYSIPPYPETQNYVKQVLSLYDKMSL
ncbi:lytic transglycosylase domain-containing protein [Methylosarcina fibrata]|uniref:lytic transglycosylase domain-containing protein n=1 Tax=Methylosarcina fibrata TaxID=105972 RepID=UPI000382C755|nr:lytic transglycosylase domain-containing protein [Methylosarcina fibrata]